MTRRAFCANAFAHISARRHHGRESEIGPVLSPPGAENAYQAGFVMRVADSFARVTGGDLFSEAGIDRAMPGRSAWEGNFALLTHRGDDAATLNYANRFALRLWDCDWTQLTAMPSAATAPEGDFAEREALMREVAAKGFVRAYSGRRIARTGRLFRIENVTVWRLIDPGGAAFGVGAFFKDWRLV